MKWLIIVQKDLKSILREKIAWLTMILLPLTVITIAGFALSGLLNKEVPELKLAYSYSGNIENIDSLLHSLEDLKAIKLISVPSKEDGIKLVKDASVTALIIIPDNFNIGDQQNEFTIDYYYDISNQSTSEIMEGMVRGIINGLNNSLISVNLLVKQAAEYGNPPQEVLPEIISRVENAFHTNEYIHLGIQEIGGDEKNKSFYQVIPGFSVMFLLFSIIGGATKLFEERQNKTLRRILIAPVKKSDIIIGKWLSITIEGFIQAFILFIAARLIFGISLGKNPIYLLFFLFVSSCATGAIGIFLASISKSLKQANGLAMLLFMLMSALGGSWWPLNITPPIMQTIGKFTFNYWAINGIKKLILFNQTLLSAGLELIVLAGLCVIFLILSFRHFKFE